MLLEVMKMMQFAFILLFGLSVYFINKSFKINTGVGSRLLVAGAGCILMSAGLFWFYETGTKEYYIGTVLFLLGPLLILLKIGRGLSALCLMGTLGVLIAYSVASYLELMWKDDLITAAIILGVISAPLLIRDIRYIRRLPSFDEQIYDVLVEDEEELDDVGSAWMALIEDEDDVVEDV